MGTRGTINELYDLKSLEGQQQAVLSFIKQYVDSVKTANGVQIQLGSAKGAKEITNAIKQLNAEQQKLADLQLKIAKAETEYAKARLNSNKADTESVKTKKEQVALEQKLAKEKERLITGAEKEAKAIEKANNEYIKLNNSYKEASAASLKRGAELLKEANGNELLFQSLLRTDKEYLATTKSAKQYNDQLLMLEQNVGRSQRNVGNYASAFGGLNTSFAQVARELPSLTISFQQFALAISNNLPIAADEIARAKVEIARLKAEGQAAPTLFQTITKSILSFQVGLSILITVFVALAPKIADFVSGLFDGADAADKAAAKVDQFAAAAARSEGELSSLNAELDRYITLLGEQNKTLAGGDLDLLRAQLQISYQKETAAIKTRNEAWQAYLNIGKEVTKLQTEGEVNPITGNISVPTIPKEQLDKFKAQQDDVLKIYQDAGKQVQDELFNQQLLAVRINNQKIEDEKEKNEKIKQAAEELARIRKKFGEDELAAQRDLIVFRLEQQAEAEQRIAESEKFSLGERLNALTNYEKIREAILLQQQADEIAIIKQKAIEAGLGEAAAQNQIQLVREKYSAQALQLTRETNDKRLNIIKADLDKEEKAQVEAFQKRLKAIETAGAIEIAQIQKQRDEELLALAERAKATDMSFEEQQKERLKILAKYARLELQIQLDKVMELAKLETDPLKRAQLEAQAAALRLKIDDELTAEQIKNRDELKKKEEELAAVQKQLQNEVFNLIKTFTLGRFDVAKNQIQDQIDKTEEQKRKEIDAINATTLPALEKQARITNAEKKAQAERERLEVRQRQLDIQRAKFEKAFSIAQIIAKTAEAVTKAVAASPLTGGLPFSAIVAAIGAVQIATVLAQPIPKFKTGKGAYDQYEGPAWVGDGGKSEVIFRESGEVEKTKSTPTLTWVGKNDIIHPDANALMNHTLKKQGDVFSYNVPGNYQFDEMTNTLKQVGNQIERSIANKREWIVNLNNGKTSIMSKDGNRVKRYLNDNLQFGK